MNLVILKGRLTADAELKTTPSGVSVTSFTLAVDRGYVAQGEERQTDFIRCVAWQNRAEFISKYFRKGSLMLIKGELQVRNYEDKDKNKRQAYEVILDDAEFCESKKNTEQSDQQEAPQFAGQTDDFSDLGSVADDDLPF